MHSWGGEDYKFDELLEGLGTERGGKKEPLTCAPTNPEAPVTNTLGLDLAM